MYHQIIMAGNLGGDPEMRYTAQGNPVTNFSVATNRKWTNAEGTPGEETTWFRITCWGRLAEVCNQYLAKGRQVLVVGRMRPDENGGPRVWNTRDGEPRASYEVTADVVRFLGGGNGRPAVSAEEPPAGFDGGDEELPF